jgi:broad specificity phosphatase PhoE
VDARTTLIYLLRHGSVVKAETRRFLGHLDVPLSPLGEYQSAFQAQRLRAEPFAAVFSSDLSRARRTAEIIAAPHGITPVVVPALREMNMGRWDGLTGEEIGEREPAAFRAWMSGVGEFAFPEGESLGDLLARAWSAFETIVADQAGRTIAVVAHGGTNRVLLCHALGIPLGRILALGQDYGSLTVLEHRDGGWGLVRLNEAPGVLAPPASE